MSKVQPLPATYNGVRYRSRLEARWAMFFYKMNIEALFEYEGFQLENGVCYLPDFWLPRVQMWAEVKPIEPTEEEYMKARLLTKLTGYPTLLLASRPDYRQYKIIFWQKDVGEFLTGLYASLDIYVQPRRYWREKRLWIDDSPLPYQGVHTEPYIAAVDTAQKHSFRA